MPSNVESMFYYGETPWHGQGTEVQEAATSEEAIQAAGLDWEVGLSKVATDFEGSISKTSIEVPGVRVVYRKDRVEAWKKDQPVELKDACLGTVGTKYRPIQNREAFDFMDALVGEGQAIYHTAGSLGKGERVWMLVNIKGALDLPADDEVAKFLLLTNSHDGSSALELAVTPIRTVCSNTLSLALDNAQSSTKIRHTQNWRDKKQEARRVLGIAEAYYEKFGEVAWELADQQMSKDEVDEFLMNLIPDPEDEDTSKTRRQKKRHSIRRLFQGGGKGLEIKDIRHTRYAMLNAVAEYADHHRTVRATGDKTEEEARLRSSWFGTARRFKQKAFKQLVNA